MTRTLKVGTFVFAGLVLLTLAVFLLGQNRRLWDPHIAYVASFADVAGLKPGSPVRMGGVDVGTVVDVGHSSDPKDPRIHVKLSIVKSEAVRIREDTVAQVANKGLLGDKMIELSVTDGVSPVLPEGAMLKSEEPADIQKYVAKIDSIANKAEKAVENIEAATRPFGDPKFSDDLRATMTSLRVVVDGVARNDGALHRLIFDPAEAAKVDRTLNEIAAATGALHAALADVRSVTERVRNGPGLAHALVYDRATSESATGLVDEAHKSLRAVREGNGLAHTIVFGDGQSEHLMSNVNAISDDLRHVVAEMRAGRGTIGGLLVDPSVYEDIKRTVGNVERNQVLRALVRYSIKADESKPRPPAPAPPAP